MNERAEKQARVEIMIFEKFSGLDSQGSGRKYFTGLGLVFCKLAVEAQGGHVGMESEPGHGCRFCFTVPRPT